MRVMSSDGRFAAPFPWPDFVTNLRHASNAMKMLSEAPPLQIVSRNLRRILTRFRAVSGSSRSAIKQTFAAEWRMK
jgi:hypothetical protein